MKLTIMAGVFTLSLSLLGDKPYREPNYDESKIPPYTLEDPNYCTSGIGESFGYVRRSEQHGIAAHDWMWLMDFADREFGIGGR